jgi:hypothetical protein
LSKTIDAKNLSATDFNSVMVEVSVNQNNIAKL